jgi:hypothetical protein
VSNHFRITWADSGQEPKCPPNPEYPAGVDLDVSNGAKITCLVTLPTYPAPRIGLYRIRCETCDVRVAVTTAGRPDDPRSVRIACKLSSGFVKS